MKRIHFQYIGLAMFSIFIIGNIISRIFFPNSFVNEMTEDYFPTEINGKIYDFMPIKGGSLYAMLHTQHNDDGIDIRNSSVVKKIKKGMYLKKLPNTNQCYVIKDDSIMYFNCFDRSFLTKEDSIKIGQVKEWNSAITNHWVLKK
ncbi:hypothetical protein [Chryseobacterium rhizosphaerae]|uniref:hypothetical protein n=1 Tax=Chryseobacterium rhizosphaerae TaxID=395937 RepID=UPI002359C69D|nr:hypothetical protein [Chryseobacterium rhizosphaerae]MDC8099818.1 hypothetical protein [Chryseobacterium rhizosphaerae]